MSYRDIGPEDLLPQDFLPIKKKPKSKKELIKKSKKKSVIKDVSQKADLPKKKPKKDKSEFEENKSNIIKYELDDFNSFKHDYQKTDFIKSLLERTLETEFKNEHLRKSNSTKNKQNRNLKVGFNKKIMEGTNKYISLNHAMEILIYYVLYDISRKQAETDNEGKRSSFPFLYETNAKKLSSQFKISYEKAQKTIKFFNMTGAWKLVKTKRDKLCVFQLGERKMVRVKGKLYAVDTIYFNLSRNETRNYYKKEKLRLGYKKS